MLTRSIGPAGTLSEREVAATKTNTCKPDMVSAVPVKFESKGGKNVMTIAIDPAGSLGEKEMAIIRAKLRNPDGISAVPVNVEKNTLRIGADDAEFADDWEFIGRKLGYRVHSV